MTVKAKPRVLVVEDEPHLRYLYGQLYQLHGCETIPAATTAEALAYIAATSTPPDAVMLDLMLPDQPGCVVLAEVRRRGWKTRVVVATAMPDGPMLDMVRGLGPDAVLTKPFDVDELMSAVLGSAP